MHHRGDATHCDNSAPRLTIKTVGAASMAADIVTTPPPNLNISALAREHGVDRRTIKRWQQKGWAPPAPATIKIVEQSQSVPTDAHPPGRRGRHWIMGLASGVLGLVLAGVGLVINA